MDKHAIANFLRDNYGGVIEVSAWGEQSFFYNPGEILPRGIYFATLKDKDGANDKSSELHRENTFRLNLGVSKESYRQLFGEHPARPAAGGTVLTGHNFSQLDTLLPHPVYAWMSWICVLNPSARSFETLGPLLDEAYSLAQAKFAKRKS